MTQLLAKLNGNELAGFVLVLARVAPLFVIAPMFSSKSLPARARGIAAVGIAIGLTPIALHGQHVPHGALPLAKLLFEGLLTGFSFAFAVGLLFATVETAASFLDSTAGFTFGEMVNPESGNPGGAFSQVYVVLGLLIFLTIGGEEWTLRGLAKTFELVPLTAGPNLSSVVGGAERAFVSMFTGAVEIIAPVMLAVLVTDVAIGVVSRVVPQLNVFAVGFPTKIAVSFLLVAATFPFVAGWISQQLSYSVSQALGTLGVA